MTRYKPARIPEEELLADIEGVIEQLGRVPTRAEYREQGNYSTSPLDRAFGGWANALEELGYEPVPRTRSKLDLERLDPRDVGKPVDELLGGASD